jgi:hypothetical protein
VAERGIFPLTIGDHDDLKNRSTVPVHPRSQSSSAKGLPESQGWSRPVRSAPPDRSLMVTDGQWISLFSFPTTRPVLGVMNYP